MFYISVSTWHLLKLLLHTTYGHKGHFWAHKETGAHKLVCMHTILVCLGPYLGPIVLDQGDLGIYEIQGTGLTFLSNIETCAHKLVCMHTVFLHALAHILAPLCPIRKIEVSMRPGGHTGHFWAHIDTCSCKLVCMHTVSLRAWAHIFALLCWIRVIEVSMISGNRLFISWHILRPV